MFSRRALARGMVALACLTAAGCGSSRSWLGKPHQRELLSDRMMRFDSRKQERAADQHVLQTREGAMGGNGTAGGGCGCN